MRPWMPLQSTSPMLRLRVADLERRAVDDELARRRRERRPRLARRAAPPRPPPAPARRARRRRSRPRPWRRCGSRRRARPWRRGTGKSQRSPRTRKRRAARSFPRAPRRRRSCARLPAGRAAGSARCARRRRRRAGRRARAGRGSGRRGRRRRRGPERQVAVSSPLASALAKLADGDLDASASAPRRARPASIFQASLASSRSSGTSRSANTPGRSSTPACDVDARLAAGLARLELEGGVAAGRAGRSRRLGRRRARPATGRSAGP